MSTRMFLAAAGLALAMFVTGAAPAAAQDAPPPPPPAAKKKPAQQPRGPAAEASRAATESTSRAPGAAGETVPPPADAVDDADAPETAAVPRAPSAVPASPPRPLGQTTRVGRVALPTRTDPKTGKQVVVIGNADLERLYGNSIVPVSSSESAAGPGSGSAMRDDPAASDPDDVGAAAPGGNGAAREAELDAEIKRLNDNVRSMANPFLPPPKLTDAEKAAVDGKNNKERIDMTRERIQELQQEKARLESSPSGAEPSGR